MKTGEDTLPLFQRLNKVLSDNRASVLISVAVNMSYLQASYAILKVASMKTFEAVTKECFINGW